MRMSKNLFQKTFKSLLIALLVASCTAEQNTRMRSFGDGDFQAPDQTSEEVTQQSAEVQRLEEMMNRLEILVEEQFGKPSGERDQSLLYAQVIQPLQDIILNPNYILNPDNRFARSSTGRNIMPRLVSIFNEAIIMVNEGKPEMITQGFLDQYRDMVLWECDFGTRETRLEGPCSFIRFFRFVDGPNMSLIMDLLISRERSRTDISPESARRNENKLILAYYDIANRRLNGSLRYYFLERISGIFRDAENVPRAQLAREANMFANVLGISNFSGDDQTDFSDVIATLGDDEPLAMSRSDNDVTSPAMTEIIRLASRTLLYTDESRTQLTESMQNSINSLKLALGRDFEQGVDFIFKNIRGEWSDLYSDFRSQMEANTEDEFTPTGFNESDLAIMNNVDAMDVDVYGDESHKIIDTILQGVTFEDDELDEYFFLTHQAYYGHYNLDDSVAFWSQSSQDQSRLIREVDKLMKLHIANSIVYTNVRMNQFYENHQGGRIIELLLESDKESSRVRKAWDKLMVRSRALYNLVDRVINPELLSAEDRETYNKIITSVDAMRKNIKYLVTYPSMFPLLHVMAKGDLNETFRFFGRQITIHSNTVISIFFSGRFFPWFNFNNDLIEFNSVEITYSYYYALITQVFETYSTNSRIAFSHEAFFEEVIQKLLLETRTEMETQTRDLIAKKNDFENSVNSIIRMCREEERLQQREAEAVEQMLEDNQEEIAAAREAGTSIPEEMTWYTAMKEVMARRFRSTTNLAFGTVNRQIYNGTMTAQDTGGGYVNYIYGNALYQVFEKLRVEYERNTLVAETVLDIYRFAGPGDAEQIDAIYAQQFAEFNQLSADFAREWFAMEEPMRGCDLIFSKRHRDIRHMMIYREAEYLGKIFDGVFDAIKGLSEEEISNLASSPVASVSEKLAELRNEMSPINMMAALEDTEYTQMNKYPAEYKDEGGYNQISATQVQSYSMDTYTRTKYYMGELFPGEYEISMPANMVEESFYTKGTPSLIRFNWEGKDSWGELEIRGEGQEYVFTGEGLAAYKDAREAFIESGIRTIARQMTWANTAIAPTGIFSKGDMFVRLFKLNQIALNPEVDCDDETLPADTREASCRKISARQVIDAFVELLHFMNIDERDREILGMLGEDHKYDENIYERIIKRDNEHELYSMYDLIYKRIFSDNGPTTGEAAWFTDDLKQYALTTSQIRGSTFVIPYADEINEIYTRNYNARIDNYYELNKEFLQEIIDEVRNAEIEPFVFAYNTARRFTLGNEANAGSDIRSVALEPLLSDLMFGKMDGLADTMSDDTVGYFSGVIEGYRSEYRQMVRENP